MHNNNSIKAFEKYAKEYDLWFKKNRPSFVSELLLMKRLVPNTGKGLEIGVGTGRFSSGLGIKIGIDPAFDMLLMAKKRGIRVFNAKAEDLPFKDNSFDFVVMITVLSFLPSPLNALKEARRVIKNKGHIIIGMINKESALGRLYESKKAKSRFYKHARFYSVEVVLSWFKELRFNILSTYQTIFQEPELLVRPEPIKRGYKEGGFVGILARKSC